MPTYAYLCNACGHRMEAVQRMSEDALTDCPQCGKSALARQISAVGFALKGTGWYVTDFRDKGKSAASKSSDGDSGSSTTTPSSSTEASKPAETKPAASSGEAA